ncbi:MAG: hypothetical protein QM597_05350 [Aeromicrobium sp.]
MTAPAGRFEQVGDTGAPVCHDGYCELPPQTETGDEVTTDEAAPA